MREKRTYEKQKEHGEDMSYESEVEHKFDDSCLLYTSPSPRD